MLLDGRLDVGADEGLEDDALDAEPDDDFHVLELGGEGEDDDGDAGLGGAYVGEKRSGVAAGVKRDEEQVGLLPLFEAIDEVLLFREEMEGVLVAQRGTEVLKNGEVRLKNADTGL